MCALQTPPKKWDWGAIARYLAPLRPAGGGGTLVVLRTHSGVRVDCREDCAAQGDCFSLIKAGDTSGTVKQQAMAKQSLGPSSSYS